jgi:hypothetical protein
MFTSSTGHGRRGFQPTLIHFGGIPDLGRDVPSLGENGHLAVSTK